LEIAMAFSQNNGALRARIRGTSFATRQSVLNSAAVALLAVIVLAGPCAAQNPPPPRTVPQTPDTNACSPLQREGTVGSSENLSDKLERGEGVICPPRDVDPDIATPPPAVGRTPVIPPPGSPGGDPTVRPK
jgi:hypothetical protein